MAGSASNWYHPKKGKLAGQAVYVPSDNRFDLTTGNIYPRARVLRMLETNAHATGWLPGDRPAGVAKTRATPRSANSGSAYHPDKTSGNNTITLGDTHAAVLDARGQFVMVQTPHKKAYKKKTYDVVNVHTGERVVQGASEGDARSGLASADSAAGPSHVAKYLDSEGRATGTIRPERLRFQADEKTTLEDIMKFGPGLETAAKLDVGDAVYEGMSRGDVFMATIQQHHGFDALPQKVSKKQLNQMLESGEISTLMSRGAGGYEEAFIDGPLFSAGNQGRMNGAGTYVASFGGKDSPNQTYAEAYTDNYVGRKGALRMGLRADARTIDTDELDTMRGNWVRGARHDLYMGTIPRDSPEFQARSDIIGKFEQDKGYFAAALGYDAITADYGSFQGAVILNRSAVVVQDTLEEK